MGHLSFGTAAREKDWQRDRHAESLACYPHLLDSGIIYAPPSQLRIEIYTTSDGGYDDVRVHVHIN